MEKGNHRDAQVFYTNGASFHNTFTNNFLCLQFFPLRKFPKNKRYIVELNAAHFKFTTTNVVYLPSIPNCNKPLTF